MEKAKHLDGQSAEDNVVHLSAPRSQPVAPFTDEEVIRLRQFMDDFAIIRATCPMAIRALSKRR